MSAIYGMIDLKREQVPTVVGERFVEGYKECKIDRHEQKIRDNAMMGCELQYFTVEARNEVLPIVDEEHHIMFTADCVIDNREELMQELAISDTSIADGTLMYKGYLKWGCECVSHFRGLFSFVVYDWEQNEVKLYSDHFSTRCLFYHVRDGVLYFSTMLFPMIQASGLKYKANERWLVDTISLRGPVMIIEPRECAYQDVWKVESGHYVEVNEFASKYVCYWNPEKLIATDYSITDEECERLTRKYMAEAVKVALRTDGEVAVSLSSGLDSSTIGCLAAPMLQEQGKKLYSYTSVPLKESNLPKGGYYVNDETDGVLEICRHYPNIVPEFVECKGRNILNRSEQILEMWEMPCKSQQNAVWIDSMRELAAEQGCKIMLTGATGNCTLSAGRVEDYVMQSVYHFKWGRAVKDLTIFCKKYRVNRKFFAKNLAKSILSYHVRFFDKERMDCYKDNITRRDIGDKYSITRRYNKDILQVHPIKSLTTMRNEIYMPKANAQIGEIDTKHSLKYGILDRDPIRNVEFVEFCFKLPMYCYVNSSYDRRLVREFMHDIVPEAIRLDVRHRGRQSGDNVYRISQSWDKMKEKIEEALHSKETLHYLDVKQIDEMLLRLNSENLFEYEMDMRMIVDAYMFSRYLSRIYAYVD